MPHVPASGLYFCLSKNYTQFSIFFIMKKLLLSFLPLLLVVLGGFSASAQDFSTTVTWATPGSIEVIKGGNPTLSTAEKMTLGPDQTSFTVT